MTLYKHKKTGEQRRTVDGSPGDKRTAKLAHWEPVKDDPGRSSTEEQEEQARKRDMEAAKQKRAGS